MKTLPSILVLVALIAGAGWWWVGSRPTHVVRVGDNATETARMVGDQASDAGIVARIKGRYFLERQLPALAITVNCRGGLVVLSGALDSPDLIQRAVQIARETGGVREVRSMLVVKG